MDIYTTVGLPQGAKIVYELNKDFTYTLNQSQTLCFPFKLRFAYNQVIITLANTTPFLNVFVPASRCWPSTQPVGNSITASPLQSNANPTLPQVELTWNFYSNELVGTDAIKPATITKAINVKTTYWMNVQNLQNKPSYFYCKFEYFSPGAYYVE